MELFLTGFFLSVSLALDLGIVNLAILKTGFEKGFRASFILGIGSSFGDLVYVALTLFGMSYITHNLWIRKLLWLGGTIIILIMAVRSALQIIYPSSVPKRRITRYSSIQQRYKLFFTGFLLSLSSPTSILWFATIGGSIIATSPLHSRANLAYFYSGFFLASVIWAFFLAYIGYRGGKNSTPYLHKIILFISTIVFLILAIYVFMQGYHTFVMNR
jgi:L-lysine exporter family protein LysE/ArgO